MLFVFGKDDSMTDFENRRMKLLQDVRKNYSDRSTPPAIHPRYSSVYHSIYSDETDEQCRPQNTFFLRFIIAAFLFAAVFMVDYHKEKIVNVDSQTIINEVQKDLFGK